MLLLLVVSGWAYCALRQVRTWCDGGCTGGSDQAFWSKLRLEHDTKQPALQRVRLTAVVLLVQRQF